MTATFITPNTTRRHDLPPVAPNYPLRRLVAALVAAAVVWLTVMVAAAAVPVVLAGFGGAPAAASDRQPAAAAPAIHVARPGDTLWSIATEHRGGVDHSSYVDELIDLNGGTGIVAGQAVWLP